MKKTDQINILNHGVPGKLQDDTEQKMLFWIYALSLPACHRGARAGRVPDDRLPPCDVPHRVAHREAGARAGLHHGRQPGTGGEPDAYVHHDLWPAWRTVRGNA